MKKIYIAMAAALMLAACGKENDGVAEQGYDSFVISVADLGGAGNAKAHWGSANGFYWDDGDKVLINGIEHTVHGSGTGTWTTTGDPVTSIDNGFFYVASYNGGVDVGNPINGGRSFGSVDFSDGGIPLACKGKTNKLTLYPCCAVVRSQNYTFLELFDADGSSYGTVSGRVLRSGNIDIANVCLSGGQEITYEEGIYPAYTDDNGYNYFIIPMEGKSVTAKLKFDWEITTRAPVTIQQGYIYDVD